MTNVSCYNNNCSVYKTVAAILAPDTERAVNSRVAACICRDTLTTNTHIGCTTGLGHMKSKGTKVEGLVGREVYHFYDISGDCRLSCS